MSTWLSRHPLLSLLLVAILSLAAGVGLTTLVVDEKQAAVDSEPVAPTMLTAPVVAQALRNTLPIDGTVEREHSTVITPAAPADGELGIVTAAPVSAGDTVEAGAAVIEVAGRPVFVLPGALQAYRVMGPGAEGQDVAQLNAALHHLGYDTDPSSSQFDDAAQAAVRTFYRDRGYEVPTVGETELDAAEAALTSAKRSEEAAEITLKRARRDARSTTDADPAARVTAQDALDDAERALEDAQADRERAVAEVERARAEAGPQIPIGEIAFVPTLPAVLTTSTLATGSPMGEGNLTLSAGSLIVRGSVVQTLAPDLSVGASAEIIAQDGTSAAAEVSAVAPATQAETGAAIWQVTLRSPEPLTQSWLGAPVRVLLDLASDDAVTLQVPEAAIETHADGTTSVTRVHGKERSRVSVALGGSGNGYVAVTPLAGEPGLAEGDEVVIGWQR